MACSSRRRFNKSELKAPRRRAVSQYSETFASRSYLDVISVDPPHQVHAYYTLCRAYTPRTTTRWGYFPPSPQGGRPLPPGHKERDLPSCHKVGDSPSLATRRGNSPLATEGGTLLPPCHKGGGVLLPHCHVRGRVPKTTAHAQVGRWAVRASCVGFHLRCRSSLSLSIVYYYCYYLVCHPNVFSVGVHNEKYVEIIENPNHEKQKIHE